MADYYVSSVDGNDADNGTTWALAKATLTGALAVATTNGDVIRVSHVHQEVLTGDITYTAGAHVNIIVVDRSNSDAPAVMDGTNGYIGHTSTSYGILAFAGAFKVYSRGLYFLSSGSTAKSIVISSTDGCHSEWENCTFKLTANAGSYISLGNSSANANNFIKMVDCVVVATNAAQRWLWIGNAKIEFYNLTTSGTSRFATIRPRAGSLHAEGCDFSNCTNADFFTDNTESAFIARLVNCKLPSATTILASQTTHPNLSSTDVFLYNCSTTDEHYRFAHYNAFGETTVSTTDYVTADGAVYDGTNKCSWKIVTTANCSFYTPYVSPWIDAYKAAADGLTLSLEGLRASETVAAADTVFKNDEVWGEFSTQATTNSTKSTIVNDRMVPLGSNAAQTSTKATTDWTINSANDAYKSAFKLESGTVNQKEIGHIRARVCAGIVSTTFYIDPQIRGLT